MKFEMTDLGLIKAVFRDAPKIGHFIKIPDSYFTYICEAMITE